MKPCTRPDVPLEPAGPPSIVEECAWQTYMPQDPMDDRLWEHNATRDRWFLMTV